MQKLLTFSNSLKPFEQVLIVNCKEYFSQTYEQFLYGYNDLLLLYNPHVVFYIIFVMTHFYYKLTEIELFNTFSFKIGDYYLLYKNL